jgi:hypothetical protein
VISKELQASAQRTGIEADPRAARPFRLAAVRLSDEPHDTEAFRAASAEAANHLVGLALAEAGDDLRRLLTPDPAEVNVIWTVACYQIGDLTPSAIRDFPDPVDAVATVAACPDEAHVAAELVASTAHGLRWTAMLRTNDLLSFQLPSSDTASDASRERPGDLSAALKRWRERLVDWSAHSGHERDTGTDTVGFAQLGAIDVTSGPVEVSPATWATPSPQVAPAMSTAMSPMPVMSPSAQTAVLALNERFSSLESTIANLATGLEAFATAAQRREERTAALERSMDTRMHELTAFVHHAVADLQQSVINRLDATEQRVTASMRESSSDAINRIRDVDTHVSAARRGIESAVRDEVSTVLLGMRAGLTPLTNEIVQRLSAAEREVDDRLSEALSELGHELAVVCDAVADLQDELASPRADDDAVPAESAVDIRD